MSFDRFDAAPTPSKIFGVCAWIADSAGIDPLLVRVGAVLLLLTTHVALIAYCVTALALRIAR